MTEVEPIRLRSDPEAAAELRLALLDSDTDLPSDHELAALRLALVPEVGEPVRLRREVGSALGEGVTGLNDSWPSEQQLASLRQRLPLNERAVLPSRLKRRTLPRVVSALAWLAPLVALAAVFWLRDRSAPERAAPVASHEPAKIQPIVVPERAPSALPPPTPSALPPRSPAASSSGRVGASPPAVTPRPSELELMHDARALLSNDPSGALSVLNRHARFYPTGVLGQEREVLAIDALLRLGRKAEANARATRFSSTYPASAHWPHIQRLLSNAGS